MKSTYFSNLVLLLFSATLPLFGCLDENKFHTTKPQAGEQIYSKTVSVKADFDKEKNAEPAVIPLAPINKLALKYGTSTRVYRPNEVDRIPLFSSTCLQEENAAECSSEKLSKYIVSHINYSSKDVSRGNEGHELVHFVVDKDGSVMHTKIVSTLNKNCENCKQAVLELFDKMDKWVPGRKNGKNVAVELSVPIRFEIEY
ncbi:MAG TPA: energy transducer TonB [Saprospiraceae bacterium]|nr:energy transducer TonB [Saprospiraceae bacterium]